MGGALSVHPGIVVDMKRMNRVLSLDTQALTVQVQSGIRLRPLGEYLVQHGLLLGHDPWSISVATVGGAISTNGLGYLGGRYGSMADQVLGLEAVLGNGAVIRTPAARKRSTGPDLSTLLIGAEGTLGIITEATLQVFPQPERQSLIGFTFPDFASGFQALLDMQQRGVRPTSMDLSLDTWPTELQERRAELHIDIDTDATQDFAQDSALPYLVLVFEGLEQEVAVQRDLASTIVSSYGAILEDNPADLDTYWSTRHAVADRWAEDPDHREGTWLDTPGGKAQLDFLHMTIPVAKLLNFRLQAAAVLDTSPVQLCQEAVWIWPECYSLVLYCSPLQTADAAGGMRQTTDAILQLGQDIGGSIEYVHGMGVRFGHLAQRELGSGMAVLHSLKASLDPAGIMNPGKLGLSSPFKR
jgi:alkyldihydroxyacetonephosphate synthase